MNSDKMNQDLLIRRAEINDVINFNSLVTSLGRTPYFRAIFGPYNYSNIIEYSHLTLLATTGGNDENTAVGFVSITDSTSLDSLSFDSVIIRLQKYLPLQVMHLDYWHFSIRISLA
jgi:hypothetical protein